VAKVVEIPDKKGRVLESGPMPACAQGLLLNVAGSVIALIGLYGLYIWCSLRSARNKASAELWWLPAWKCFRLVLRNIPVRYEVTDIRSRAWLRDVVPRRDGSSVNSFKDVNLACAERVVLSRDDDYPIVCFRLQKQNEDFHFVLTDKFGVEFGTYALSKEFEELLIEYSAKVQTWNLLKYEINRMFVFPRSDKEEGKIFEELLAMQEGPEAAYRTMFLRAETIRIAI
jgi:hypothetical protein